jgi:hypothetical protein
MCRNYLYTHTHCPHTHQTTQHFCPLLLHQLRRIDREPNPHHHPHYQQQQQQQHLNQHRHHQHHPLNYHPPLAPPPLKPPHSAQLPFELPPACFAVREVRVRGVCRNCAAWRERGRGFGERMGWRFCGFVGGRAAGLGG